MNIAYSKYSLKHAETYKEAKSLMDLKDRSQGYKVYEVLNTYYNKLLCL